MKFGWAERQGEEQCAVDPVDGTRMLCGRKAGVVQPVFTPSLLHDRCRELLAARRTRNIAPPPMVGTCPVCGGDDVPVRGRVVEGHYERRMRSGARVVSTAPCSGAGLQPEVAS